MKILITGLCLSRNLGGPAMGLTLVEQLKRRIPHVDFVFAVDANSYQQEKKWADYYGVDIVRRDNIVHHLLNTRIAILLRCLYRMIKGKRPLFPDSVIPRQIHKEYLSAISECDAVISMMGVSYVGDSVGGFFEGPRSYSSLYYSNKLKKPFSHFVQSFGPFQDRKVRYFARKDFNQVDFIPARGKSSAKLCREIVKAPGKVYDFPDIAILLPATSEPWTSNYLKAHDLYSGDYTILSPSSVIYNMRSSIGRSVGAKHILTFFIIAKKLLSLGDKILFLPHMYSDNKSQCDREVCYKIINLLVDRGEDMSHCRIVEDDIDTQQAKALISSARRAIVSRYHALVAAISTGVPVITIGWNIKYYDLMYYYGIEKMAIDARLLEPEDICLKVFELLSEYNRGGYEQILKNNQAKNIAHVQHAFDLLEDWLRKNVKN